MLRINLLPAYIAERRRVNLAILLSVVFFIAVTGIALGIHFGSVVPRLNAMVLEDQNDQTEAQKETAFETETATMLTTVAPLYDKVNLVDQIRFYNLLPGKIYRNAARYTYRRVEYNSMAVTGNNLALSANVSSLDDIGRFYLLMFGNPDVTAVSFTGVPDWAMVQAKQPIITPGGAPPAPPQYPIAMNATLVQAVVAPTLPASLGSGAAGGVGGMGMGMPSMGGPAPMSSGGPMPGASTGPPPMPGASGGAPRL